MRARIFTLHPGHKNTTSDGVYIFTIKNNYPGKKIKGFQKLEKLAL